MDVQKLYINQDRPSILICPHCGRSKSVDGSGLMRKGGQTIVVVCGCGSRFRVFFESRRGYRRDSSRRGRFAKLPQGNEWQNMLLTSVSLFGLGFTSTAANQLRAGDEIRVCFSLDESGWHQMEGDVQVVWTEGNDVGCRFKEHIQDEKFRAFYLML